MAGKKSSGRVEVELGVRRKRTAGTRTSPVSADDKGGWNPVDGVVDKVKVGASEVAGAAASSAAKEVTEGLVKPASEEIQWIVNRLDSQFEKFRCAGVAAVEESTARIDESLNAVLVRVDSAVEEIRETRALVKQAEKIKDWVHGYWIDGGVLLFYTLFYAVVYRLDQTSTLWLPEGGQGLPRFLYVVFMAATLPTAVMGLFNLVYRRFRKQVASTPWRLFLSFVKFGGVMITAVVMAVVAHLLLT